VECCSSSTSKYSGEAVPPAVGVGMAIEPCVNMVSDGVVGCRVVRVGDDWVKHSHVSREEMKRWRWRWRAGEC